MQKEAAKATTTLIEISVDGSSPMVPMRRALAMSSPFAESSHQLSAFGAERVGPGTSFRSNFLLGSSSPQVPSSSGSKVRTMASTSSGPKAADRDGQGLKPVRFCNCIEVASIVPNAGPSFSIAKLAKCGHVQTTRNRHCIRPMSFMPLP